MGKFAKLFEKLIKKYAIQFLKSKKDETITKWNKKKYSIIQIMKINLMLN